MRENHFLPSLVLWFLPLFSVQLCRRLECVTATLSEKKRIFPLFLGIGLEALSDRPHVCLRIAPPHTRTEDRSWLWKQACGMVLLFQELFFSGLLTSFHDYSMHGESLPLSCGADRENPDAVNFLGL